MKKLQLPTLGLTALFLASVLYAGGGSAPGSSANPYAASYPFKSAVISYTVKSVYGHGEASEGTETVYIRDGKLAKITKMSVPGSEGKTKEMEILKIFTPEYVYMIDLSDKTGTKIDNPKKYGSQAYDKLSDEEKEAFLGRMNKRGIVSLDLIGLGTKTGTETFLGVNCDIYESGDEMSPEAISKTLEEGNVPFNMKSWLWRDAGIPLKVITTGLGQSNELVATSIERDADIPWSRFEVPPDIKITYDGKKSEFAKRETMARFELYKTGKPMVIKTKLEKKKIKDDSGESVTGGQNDK